MDELLINANLEERRPLSLPWETDTEKKDTVNISIDGETTKLNEVSQDVEHDIIKELDEKYKSRYCAQPKYLDNYSHETGQGLYEEELKASRCENKDRVEDQTRNRYESYMGAAIYPRNDDLRSSTKYRGINSPSNRVCGVTGERKNNPTPEYFSAINTNIQWSGFKIPQSTGIKSPRNPLKISQKMVQESKSGHPLSPIAEYNLPGKKEKMSVISSSEIGRGSTTGQINGAVKYGTDNRGPTNSNTTASASHVDPKNKDNNINSKEYGTRKTSDLDVDHELDNLLKETADAINYKCSRNDEGKEHESKGNGFKKKNSSVSIYCVPDGKIEVKDNKPVENEGRLKSRREKLSEKIDTKQHIYSAEDGEDEMMEVGHHKVQTKKKKDNYRKWNGREKTYDMKDKMDIIDGIVGDVFDRKEKIPNRKMAKTKQTKRSDNSKTNLDVKCLDSEKETGSTRKPRKKKSRHEKTKVNTPKSHGLRDEGPSREPLMDQKDTEYDMFDISPVKNRETISDLEDNEENMAESIESKFAVPKRKQSQKFKKDNANALTNIKLTGEQSLKSSSKGRKKKTKMDVTHKTNVSGDIEVQGFNYEKQLSPNTMNSQSVNDSLTARRKQKRRIKKDNFNVESHSVSKTVLSNGVGWDNESLEKRPVHSTSYTIIKHEKTNGIHYTNSVVKSADNDRVTYRDGDEFKKANTEHCEMVSRSNNVHVDDAEQAASRNELKTLENSKVTPGLDLGELVYDSDTDTDIISDLTYQQYLIYRPPSEQSKEFEFPRPASNRTFIIDSDNDACDDNDIYIDGNISVPRDVAANTELPDKGEKKLTKWQRFINFIMSCCKSKTDE